MQSSTEVQNIKVTKDIVVVEITRVLVPGAILDLHKKSLASFGTVPFTVVCRKTQLQTMYVRVSPGKLNNNSHSWLPLGNIFSTVHHSEGLRLDITME